MHFRSILPIAILLTVASATAALAQYDDPLGRNQTEGQLTPEQAWIVDPPEESIRDSTTASLIPGDTALLLGYPVGNPNLADSLEEAQGLGGPVGP